MERGETGRGVGIGVGVSALVPRAGAIFWSLSPSWSLVLFPWAPKAVAVAASVALPLPPVLTPSLARVMLKLLVPVGVPSQLPQLPLALPSSSVSLMVFVVDAAVTGPRRVSSKVLAVPGFGEDAFLSPPARQTSCTGFLPPPKGEEKLRGDPCLSE